MSCIIWIQCINFGSIADICTAFVACIAFVLSVIEYRNHKKRERIKNITDFNVRYMTHPDLRAVIKYLEAVEDGVEDKLESPDIHQIEMFMRFYEELWCMIKASAIKREVVYYMFGHYSIVFDDNKQKWPETLGYDKMYWSIFREFVLNMRDAKQKIEQTANISKLISL